MDRHRGDYRSGNPEPYRSSRMPSRWSSSPSSSDHPPFNHRYPPNPRSSGFSSDGHLPFDSPPNHHPFGSGPPSFRPMGGGGGGYGPGPGHPMPMSGQKRGRGSPDRSDGGNFAKLFIGSVPRTATEDDIRPLFEEHGNVVEVALIKDKRTGQQQGCCFVKFATSEEADRAIRALHNQVTLPGGLGPIQVRYADGERERLGNFSSAVEYKLFVGSMNRQATEREIEEVFSPYGRVEDVYIMKDDLKQSRGCGFVKFSHREMAEAAIRALNGTYVMRGCDQPLTVRFADPKRPRPGESRFGPAFGGPGFGPRSQEPLGVRPPPNLGDPSGGRFHPNAWQPMSPKNAGPSSQVASPFGSHLPSRDGVGTLPSSAAGSLGVLGGTTNGSLQGLSVTPSSTSQQTPSAAQIQPFGRQMSPLQKPLQSPQHLPSSLQLNQQHTPTSLSQAHSLQTSNQQLGQLQLHHSIGQHSLGLALPSQPLYGPTGQLSASQPQVQPSVSAAALQTSLNMQQQGLPAAAVQQQLLQPAQQPPSQLSQVLMQQQVQALQSSFQSSQQAFSQIQQQFHSMQPTTQSQQLNSQASKPQSPWSGVMSQTAVSSPASAPATVAPSTISAAPAVSVGTQASAPQTCNWTEHTSPEGYKYYYNSITTESRWEKPEEFALFEQQQKLQQQHLQKLSVPQLQSQSQTQLKAQIQSNPQQASQMQQLQSQTQVRQQQPQPQPQPQIQLRHPSLPSSYQGSGGIQNVQDSGYAQLQATNSSVIDCARFQQGLQAAQEWMWKNKPAGFERSIYHC